MTNELRTLIDLADIKGVELECRKCGTRTIYPLSVDAQRLAQKCPNCFEPWFKSVEFPQQGESIREQLGGWINSIQNIIASQNIFARVRLHIDASELLSLSRVPRKE